MSRTSYEIVAYEADQLTIRMATASSIRQIDFYWDAYLNLLRATGWTDQEFDKETLRRIDEYWQRKFRHN